MSDKKPGSFVQKLVLVLMCLAIAGLGAWMIVDPSGFLTGADANTGSAKAKFLKTVFNFATDSIGVRPTGAILAGIGLSVMWLVMRPSTRG